MNEQQQLARTFHHNPPASHGPVFLMHFTTSHLMVQWSLLESGKASLEARGRPMGGSFAKGVSFSHLPISVTPVPNLKHLPSCPPTSSSHWMGHCQQLSPQPPLSHSPATSLALWSRHPPREQKILGSILACAGIFLGSSHTNDFKIGTPVATLPGAWCLRVSAGTGWPCVSILWLGEMESWICNFYLSVAAREIEQIRPWDTLTCLLGR